MSNRKFVEVPEEFTGKPLEARISRIEHEYKYIDIYLEIFLPDDAGTATYRKRLWSKIPSNAKTDFSKQNEASLYLWREILGIPSSINNYRLVENIDILPMLDMFEYRLGVSMEPGENGRRYLKVISYEVCPREGWDSIRAFIKERLLEIRSLSRELETYKSIPPMGSKERPRRATAGEAPAVYPWAKPWGTESESSPGESIKDYI